MLEPESDLDVGLIDALEDVLTDKTVSKKEVHSSGVISDLFDRKVLAKIEEAFISKSVISSAAIGDSSRTVEEGLLTNKAAKKRTINSSHINEFDTIISNTLDAEEFKLLLSEFIPDSLVDTITSAIDVNDTGTIYYSDFTNYLISAGDSDIRSGNNFANRLTMHNNQNDQQKNTHSDSIDHIVCVRKPCPMIVTGGRDGKLILFDSDSLELIANISHRDKNSVFLEELQGNMDVEMRSRCIQIAEREGIAPSRNSAVRHVRRFVLLFLKQHNYLRSNSIDSFSICN